MINVKNIDKCFSKSVMAILYRVPKTPQRTLNYTSQHENIFDIHGIRYPLTLSNIARFERPNDVSINTYDLQSCGKDYKVVGALYYTKHNTSLCCFSRTKNARNIMLE